MFYGANIEQEGNPSGSGRPVLPINVLGILGTAIANTGARRSIIDSNLYELLKIQCRFEPKLTRLTLANDSVSSKEVLTAKIEVTVGYKII